MYKLELDISIHPTSGLRDIGGEAYTQMYDTARKTEDTLIKFNTNALQMSEGMWAICIDQKGIDLVKNDASVDETFDVIVANDCIWIPPLTAGKIITLKTQGSARPCIDVDAFIAQVDTNLNNPEVTSVVRDIWYDNAK